MKKILWKIPLLSFLVIFISITLLTSCSKSGSNPPQETGVKITSSALFGNRSSSMTPTVYKIALVNLWFIKLGGTKINVLNPDEDNPTYTENNPFILNFSTTNTIQKILATNNFESGTYTGFEMQFLYLEMQLPVAFHVPDNSYAADYSGDLSVLLDNQIERNFRLYFNALDNTYWKRDFVAELDPGSDEWYWLRRAIDASHSSFFIPVTQNGHPSSGIGTESTIDLGANAAFWGDPADYADSSAPIIISTNDPNNFFTINFDNFLIPGKLDGLYTINIEFDIQNTMLYDETLSAPVGVTFTNNVLDLGPMSGQDSYGDQGLHPELPSFNITVSKK